MDVEIQRDNWWVRLVKFGFRLLYQEFAWSYDAVSWLVSLGEWRAWQRAALPFLRGKRLLEVGHGPGHMLQELATPSRILVGLDLSPQMGRQAQRRLRRRGLPALLVRGRVQALPFPAKSFDAVLSTFPTDYIVDEAALAELSRVLVENGRLVILPEGHLTGRGLRHRLIDWAFRITGQRRGPFAVDQNRFWPAEELWAPLRARFADAGFVVTIHQVRRSRSAATVIVAEKNSRLFNPA